MKSKNSSLAKCAESCDSGAWDKWQLADFAAFYRVLKHHCRQWFCKLGWLSWSLRGQEVLIQQLRWAVTTPAEAGRERSVGNSRWGGNGLVQRAPREHKTTAKLSQGRVVSLNQYQPLLSISCDWFFCGYFIASPIPSKVSLSFTTDTTFLWEYQSSPEQEGRDTWIARLLWRMPSCCCFFNIQKQTKNTEQLLPSFPKILLRQSSVVLFLLTVSFLSYFTRRHVVISINIVSTLETFLKDS